MINSQRIRAWATPLTIGSFVLAAITGIMLFFRLNIGLVKVSHEWFSWFLVIGGLFHVVGSWRSFVQYFSKPAGKIIMGVFALLIVLSFIPMGNNRKGIPPAKISKMLLQSPFATVAAAAGHQPEELMATLKTKGISIESKDETAQEIAVKNNKQGAEVLDLIF